MARHTVSQMRALLPLLLLTGCGLPALSSEDVFGLEVAPRAWVYGTVANAQTGGPVANVVLQLADSAAQSDVNGAFRLDGLSPGPGELAASREGFTNLGTSVALHAGGNRLELRMLPLRCGTCGENEVCDPVAGNCVQAASLTGAVVDACSQVAIAARLTIGGKITCSTSTSGKGYWQLSGLPIGGPQTLAVGKTGYQAYSTQLTLKPGFNAFDAISLMRVGGCIAPEPSNPAVCSCTEPNCQ